jgi:YrbI family 3-deoxy-D-manno-octulosonate 8-phosphate phosphatase
MLYYLKYFKLNLDKKILPIKFLLMDCDGVLTDGGMYDNGMKKFNCKDGIGIILLQKAGINTGIISGDSSVEILNRAKKLNMKEYFTNVKDKLHILEYIKEKYNLHYNEIAFIGDDINDLEVIKKVGFSITVNDAVKEVKKVANYITNKKGGYGAVREVTDLIRRVKNESKNVKNDI